MMGIVLDFISGKKQLCSALSVIPKPVEKRQKNQYTQRKTTDILVCTCVCASVLIIIECICPVFFYFVCIY